MRDLNLLLTFALLFTVSAVHAGFVVPPGLAVRQASSTSGGASLSPSKTANSNPRPTGGEGDPIQGDVDVSPTQSEDPVITSPPITTTDKDGKTIVLSPSPSSRSTSTRSKKIAPDAQPGTVQMRTPSVYDGYQIYKIGDPVTFVWNYTNLQVTPTALNIQAYCTDGAQYFPIAMNVSADTTEVIWDTGAYESTALSKLPVATYTLVIFDSARGATSFPSPGYLYPFSGYSFGMYIPRPPTPLASFECPTCNPSSASALDIRAIRIILGMSLVTALSFMWFIAGVL